MATWIEVDNDARALAEAIALHMRSTVDRVTKMALALMAVDLGLRFELPPKEKSNAG